MAGGDERVVIASCLTSVEAGLVRGLLESAGIGALVVDGVGGTRAVLPGLPGARLLVRARDAGRAAEIVRASGAFPGAASDEPVEIPEEEWSRAAGAESRGEGRARPAPWSGWALGLLASALVLALLLALARL